MDKSRILPITQKWSIKDLEFEYRESTKKKGDVNL